MARTRRSPLGLEFFYRKEDAEQRRAWRRKQRHQAKARLTRTDDQSASTDQRRTSGWLTW